MHQKTKRHCIIEIMLMYIQHFRAYTLSRRQLRMHFNNCRPEIITTPNITITVQF